jgi:hypothetical protein
MLILTILHLVAISLCLLETSLRSEIWGFHGGEDDDDVLLGFGAVKTRQ